MAVHVVNVGLVQVTPTGEVKRKDSMTIGESVQASTETRVLPNDSVPNSQGYPTIEQYLTSEDGDGFQLRHMDQYFIVTYN